MEPDNDLPGAPFHLSPPEKTYTLDEAARVIHSIQVRLMAVEEYRLKLNWCLGLVLAHTEIPRRARLETIKELAHRVKEKHGVRVSKTLLYECEKLYQLLNGDLRRFETWINGNKRLLGRAVYWSDVQNQLLGGRNNPDIIGREEADRRDLLEAERATEAIERVALRAYVGGEQEIGALEGIRQTLEGLSILPDDRPRSVRDDDYLAFVGRHGCLICEQPSEAHHAFGHRGESVKSSDYTCVPLCRRHHHEVHQRGARRVEDAYGVDFLEAAFNLFHRYATGQWLTLRVRVLR